MAGSSADHILIVDDDPAHRLLIKRALMDLFSRNNLQEAASVDKAVKMLDQLDYVIGIAIVDYKLGSRCGLEVLEFIRKRAKSEILPVIMISTSDLPVNVEASYRAGANCFIFKSTEAEEFSVNIRSAVSFFLRGRRYSTPD